MHVTAIQSLEVENGIRIYQDETASAVIRPWRGLRHLVALFIGVIIAMIALSSYLNATGQGAPWWAVGLLSFGIIYYALTGLNTTTIRMTACGVTVTRGPLPVLGGRCRHFPRIQSLNVRFDRIITPRGGVGDIYVIEAITSCRAVAALDLVSSERKARTMARFIERGIETNCRRHPDQASRDL